MTAAKPRGFVIRHQMHIPRLQLLTWATAAWARGTHLRDGYDSELRPEAGALGTRTQVGT